MTAQNNLLQLYFPAITDPAIKASVPAPLYVVDTSVVATNFYMSASGTAGYWLFAFNFRVHPLVSVQGNYTTGVSFVNLTGPDSSMQVTSYSFYNGLVGVIVQGGTINQTYELVVGVTLSNSQVVSSTLNITLKN